MTSTFASLALVLGILVADLTNVRNVTVAGAQNGRPVADGTIVGHHIEATDVLVNGVITSGVFVGNVRVVDSILVEDEGDGVGSGGVYPGDNNSLDSGGVYPGDSNSLDSGGVYPGDSNSLESGGVYPGDTNSSAKGGVYPGDQKAGSVLTDVRVTGGVVEGDNVRVVNGRIHGSDMRVVGAVVSRARRGGGN